jgi:hypothetical protein
VKVTVSRGFVCLLFGALMSFGQAQSSQDGQAPPQSQTQASDGDSQTPAQQQQPPAQQPPPPAQQTPPAQPAQPQPPSVPGTPQIPKPTVQLPPTLPPQTPTPPQERDTGGDTLSLALFYWLTSAQPILRGGAADTTFLDGNLNFIGNKKYALEGIVTIPTGHENSLEFTYVRKQGFGNSIIPTTENFFGNNYTAGDLVITRYTLETLKLSWNYLTWPYPSNGAKFRVKTLWEVQYAGIGSTYDAPLDPDATPASGNKSVILPTLGLGWEYHPARHFRLEMKASGFGIVHHADIWDAQFSAVARYGKIELFLSYKGYHFKTSPKSDQYFTETMLGPIAGVRLMFR